MVEQITQSKPDVRKNDEILLEEVDRYDKIILSPGPGLPKDAGILNSLISRYASSKSILGVCLGHQAIGEVFGGKLINMSNVQHGIADAIQVTDNTARIFKDMQTMQVVGRYHSWVLDHQMIPTDLIVTAVDQQQQVMAISHKHLDVCGVQFHPESIMTPNGRQMMANWIFCK